MIKYKVDVLFEMKKRGFTPSIIKKQHILSERTMSSIRAGIMPTGKTLDTLCTLLQCQPGDILEWVPDPAPSNANTP